MCVSQLKTETRSANFVGESLGESEGTHTFFLFLDE